MCIIPSVKEQAAMCTFFKVAQGIKARRAPGAMPQRHQNSRKPWMNQSWPLVPDGPHCCNSSGPEDLAFRQSCGCAGRKHCGSQNAISFIVRLSGSLRSPMRAPQRQTTSMRDALSCHTCSGPSTGSCATWRTACGNILPGVPSRHSRASTRCSLHRSTS
jgi:hypothetical protein